jgi:hypothetical protein
MHRIATELTIFTLAETEIGEARIEQTLGA